MLVFLAAAVLQTSTISITDAIAIGDVSKEGRRPIPDDAILRQIVDGAWTAPKAGDIVNFQGKDHAWHPVKAGKDGWIQDPALDNGYVFATVQAPQDEVLLLNAQGDSLVYVNGEPRAGDVYGNGYLNLPVNLHKGTNTFLFVCGRERLKADLKPMDKPYALQTEDTTLPDVITSDRGFLWASIVVINGTGQWADHLKITATEPGGKNASIDEPAILPYSARKLYVKLPVPARMTVGKLTYTIDLFSGRDKQDDKQILVAVKDPLATQKRTFVSDTDGSVQYYAVVPAAKPSARNALVFTVHGAGVEATGQAAAYQQKDWATIVAPTNRRPYGFDWEDIGFEDFKEVELLAKKTYAHDPERVDLTGHSMGGHGTWFIGTMEPGEFASIAPSAGWISWWSYAGGWNPEYGLDTEKLVRRSMNTSDVLGRVDNTLSENVYILHGDADDNVPVEQARTMRAELQKIGHPSLHYHEQPGAGHWWGNQCVDWPPIFDMIQDSRLNQTPQNVDFTTQDLGKEAGAGWITIWAQEKPGEISHIQATKRFGGQKIDIKTTNVSEFLITDFEQDHLEITIDGQRVTANPQNLGFRKKEGTWKTTKGDISDPVPGNLKDALRGDFLFVLPTGGSAAEQAQARNTVRYLSELLMYRGNGAVDVVKDKDYNSHYRDVILFGNAETNKAWDTAMFKASVNIHEGYATVNGRKFVGSDIGGLILADTGEHIALAVAGTGLIGMRSLDRLGLFTSGVAYPDWILIQPNAPAGILADGFYSPWMKFDRKGQPLAPLWQFDPANSAFAPTGSH